MIAQMSRRASNPTQKRLSATLAQSSAAFSHESTSTPKDSLGGAIKPSYGGAPIGVSQKGVVVADCPEELYYKPEELEQLDKTFIWFKSDPRWQPLYDLILEALARVQSRIPKSCT